MTEIRAILSDRAKTHGDYINTSATCRRLMDVLVAGQDGRDELLEHEAETLHMICNKLARIVCGNPHFPDHWDDIAGYAILTADLNRERGK